MKRAQLNLQFNWIFVLIVGAIILAFFLLVIRYQTSGADIELAAEIVKNLETVVKSTEQVEGSLKELSIPDVKIEFVCEREGISFYDIGSGGRKDIPYDIIFTQGELRGRELISWTQSWDVPFRIAMFQYLTTNNAKFVIVNDGAGPKAEELFGILPSNITKEVIEQTEDVEDDNHDFYKIIHFEGEVLSPEQYDELPEERVNIITIDANTLDSYGEIFFNKEGEHITYLKKEMLLGAIFSEDAEFYECTMNKAYQRMKTLMVLNYNRTENLSNEITDTKCSALYLWNLEDTNRILSLIDNPEYDNVMEMYEKSERIARTNQNLIRGKSCPLIY
jgi:hypothetical protein